MKSSTPLIDIGVNLTSSRFEKRIEEVLHRAYQVGVHGVMITGVDLHSSQRALQLIDQYQGACSLWATAGVHPHDAGALLSQGSAKEIDWRDVLAHLLTSPRVVAVGECGLDFERDYSPRSDQLRVFEAQLELAVTHQLPIFLHQRGAHSPFLDLLKHYVSDLPKRGDDVAAVVHCFTGNREEMESYLDLGCSIGITGWICDERRSDALRDAVKHLPLHRFMVETDAPYLLPRTIRPRPKSRDNEPSYLPYVVSSLAEYMSITPERVAYHATHNTLKLFQIALEGAE